MIVQIQHQPLLLSMHAAGLMRIQIYDMERSRMLERKFHIVMQRHQIKTN